jgi:hypothetical protein
MNVCHWCLSRNAFLISYPKSRDELCDLSSIFPFILVFTLFLTLHNDIYIIWLQKSSFNPKIFHFDYFMNCNIRRIHKKLIPKSLSTIWWLEKSIKNLLLLRLWIFRKLCFSFVTYLLKYAYINEIQSFDVMQIKLNENPFNRILYISLNYVNKIKKILEFQNWK